MISASRPFTEYLQPIYLGNTRSSVREHLEAFDNTPEGQRIRRLTDIRRSLQVHPGSFSGIIGPTSVAIGHLTKKDYKALNIYRLPTGKNPAFVQVLNSVQFLPLKTRMPNSAPEYWIPEETCHVIFLCLTALSSEDRPKYWNVIRKCVKAIISDENATPLQKCLATTIIHVVKGIVHTLEAEHHV
jgi:hypothetical protein